MLALTLPLAAAASDLPVEPDPIPDLPLQVQDEERWQAIDLHNAQLGRASLVAGIAALGVGGTGAVLLLAASSTDQHEVLDPIGGTLVFAGSAGAAIVPPVLLATSLRSNRSLRERGVRASTTSAVVGWTLVGTGVILSPVFAYAPYTLPIWYAGVVASGVGQMQVNERARSDAGLHRAGQVIRGVTVLPAGRGVTLVGSF